MAPPSATTVSSVVLLVACVGSVLGLDSPHPRRTPDPVTTSFMTNFNVPASLYETCATVSRYYAPRPCPTLDCSGEAPAGSCTPAPDDVRLGSPLYGIAGCNFEMYAGHSCLDCEDNYCAREPLEGEDTVDSCPLGWATRTGAKECDGLLRRRGELHARTRCFYEEPFPSCPPPESPPVFHTEPVTTTYDDSGPYGCLVTVRTGAPCRDCPDRCTVDGPLPSEDWLACEGDIPTVTTDRACPESACEVPTIAYPCPTTAPEEETWPSTTRVKCTDYVQTGGAPRCTPCPVWCTESGSDEVKPWPFE